MVKDTILIIIHRENWGSKNLVTSQSTKLASSAVRSQTQPFYTHAHEYYIASFLHVVLTRGSLSFSPVCLSIFDPETFELIPTSFVFCSFQVQSVFKTMVKDIFCKRMPCVPCDSDSDAHFSPLFSCSCGHLKTEWKL